MAVDEQPVVIVGGGPAGLATAACLARRDVPAIVLDRGATVGQSWRERYDRLHLHTPRIQSSMPGMRIPSRYGRFVSKDDYAQYLVDYAATFGIRPHHGVEVTRVERDDAGGWLVHTDQRTFAAPQVVMAAGFNGAPVLPDWPGADGFTGDLLHAADYHAPTPWVGRRVLVVGTGNSGAEIAADLAEQGAATVWLAVRTPPNIVPLTMGPIPTTLLGIANEYGSELADPVNARLARAFIGDLTPYGMPAPTMGVKATHNRTGRVPIIDVGLVDQLKAGRVTPVAAVASFDGDDAVLTDDRRLQPDAVIAATGYRRAITPLVGHLGVLDDDGELAHRGREPSPSAPGLYFVGMEDRLIGLLNAIRLDAMAVARDIARARS